MSTAGPILVAGRSGQLAICLREHACDRDIVVVGRPDLNLGDPAPIDRQIAEIRPRAIVNAAAYTAVDKAEAEPEQAFAVNRDGAARLAAAAARLEVPFIHVSTDYVFDGSKLGAYREDDPTNPINVYGQSKLAGEESVRAAHGGAIILRTSWIYSPHGNNFVKTMLKMAETRDHVRVVGDQRGMPTAAGDLARAVFEILDQVGGAGQQRAGIYHLAGSGETTWHDFAAEVFAGLARRGRPVPALEAIPTASFPTPARRPANSCLDCTKINRVFGVELPAWQSSLDACLADLLVDRGA